ncbi:MAG: hypothetical protein N4A46_08340 [Schleiferiaceae bacterium]|nr:hypothetical protein [Schleiferiaceae bacterium]
MHLFYSWLCKSIKLKEVLIALLAYLAFLFLLMVPYADGITNGSDSPIIDLMQFVGPDALKAAISGYTHAGRIIYLDGAYLDFLYPLVYMWLFYTLLAFSFKRGNLPYSKAKLWVILIPVAVLIDYGENFFFVRLIRSYPNMLDTELMIASVFHSLKWVVIYAVSTRIFFAFVFKK